MGAYTPSANQSTTELQTPVVPTEQTVHPLYVAKSATASSDSLSKWDEDITFTTIRRYYALREEAQGTVEESKKVWMDTPFSTWAIQNFSPPRQRAGMRQILEESQECFGPLPSELRANRARSRSPRASPYPRSVRTPSPLSPGRAAAIANAAEKPKSKTSAPPTPLRQLSINPNIAHSEIVSPRGPGFKAKDNSKSKTRLQVQNTVNEPRRATAGWSKTVTSRSANENKENGTITKLSQGSMASDNSLKLTRPRPRSRLTSTATAKPIWI